MHVHGYERGFTMYMANFINTFAVGEFWLWLNIVFDYIKFLYVCT